MSLSDGDRPSPSDPPRPSGPSEPSAAVSRRRLLGAIGAGAAGTALGAAAGFAAGSARSETTGTDPAASVPFWGAHQAGIATAAQDPLDQATFDVVTDRAADLRDLLRAWTDAAAAMCQGEPAGPPASNALLPPTDTGEAFGLRPANLTITFGFGPSLFSHHGEDRFRIAGRKPAALIELPAFAGDELDPARSGGDLVAQACSDDPQVAFHAVRNLGRIGRGVVVPRWSQMGFGRTSSTTRDQVTPRNLQGFKDGTNNLRGDDAGAMATNVWVGDEGPAWMRGGSYMVTRRIRMLIEVWDRASLDDQERTIGRQKETGAPLGRDAEFDAVPLAARGPDGTPLIPVDAHVRLAAPATNRGAGLLRRGYSFTDGIDPIPGQLDAGLFFICFQRDPRSAFVPVQRQLAAADALNEYIAHVGSGIFAVPPGVQPGGYVGQDLFA